MPSTNPSSLAFPMRAHPHLYEINTWAWLDQLSARLGRSISLGDVPDAEWDALANLGFDIIWLMGVWQRSPEARRMALADPGDVAQFDRALPGWQPSDVVGSPYAVAQYIPDPRIGDWKSVDRVREKLHARGMTLFFDFVGNHTAFDHPWTRQHPEFYVQGTREECEKNPSAFYPVRSPKGNYFLARGKDPYFPPWKDVAQLNYFSPEMRAAQLAELRTIANHCDGVRCDMAMLQLSDIFASVWGHLLGGARPPEKEFWQEAHAAVPNLVLLAEAYWGTEPRLLDLGFSFVYDKGLYDAVRNTNVEDIHTRLAAPADLQSRLARFLENHDEERCANVFGNARLPSVGTLMGTLPGMRFYHQGELEGCRIRLPVPLRLTAEEPPDTFTVRFFQKILEITKQEVFHSGQWNLLPIVPEGDDTSRNLVVYEWRSNQAWKVIAVNLVGGASQGRVRLGDRVLPGREYIFFDELNGARYPRSGDELHNLGLFVRREGFQAHLFDVTPA
jgi:hypothetical protein